MAYPFLNTSNFQSQLKILHQKPSFWIKNKLNKKLEAVHYIGVNGTLDDINNIFEFLFVDEDQLGLATMSAVKQILKNSETKTLSKFSFKYIGSYRNFDWTILNRFLKQDQLLLWRIISENYNGFARERALYGLARYEPAEFLPQVLLRLNDWVPHVSLVAKKILFQNLNEISIDLIIENHIILKQLSRFTRVDHSETVKVINNYLCLPINREKLLEIMKTSEMRAKLFCWNALEEELQKNSKLVDLAINDSAPEVRQWIANKMPIDEKHSSRIVHLLTDKTIRVKYAALKAIPQAENKKYVTAFLECLFDSSNAIRDYARFYYKKITGDKDVSHLYREKFKATSSLTVGLLLGLAETGTQKDIKIIEGYLTHPRADISAASYLSLHILNASNMEDVYIRGLTKSAKIRRACTRILLENIPADINAIYQIYENADQGLKLDILKILAARRKYPALIDILNAIFNENNTIKKRALRYLKDWYLWSNSKQLGPWFLYEVDAYKEVCKLWNRAKLEICDELTLIKNIDNLLIMLRPNE